MPTQSLVLLTLFKYGLHERLILVSPRGGPITFDASIIELCTKRDSDAYHEAADKLLDNLALMNLFTSTHALSSVNVSQLDGLIIADGLGYLEDMNRTDVLQPFFRRFFSKQQRSLAAIGAGVALLSNIDGGKYIANKQVTTWSGMELEKMGLGRGQLRATPEQLLKRVGARVNLSSVVESPRIVHEQGAWWFGQNWKTTNDVVNQFAQHLTRL